MIAGVSYNVFNGEEHLLSSLFFIRKCVDFVNIVAQRVSNVGNPANPELEDIINNAVLTGLVDSVCWYEPDLSVPPVENELRKRNIGLEVAKKAGVTHFMTMDCDEYYVVDEFLWAKEFIDFHKIQSSSVRTYLHIKRPVWRSKEPDVTWCSFLTEISADSRIELNSYYPTLVDGTRGLHGNVDRFCTFDPGEISMRHMNLVRHDLSSKLSNSSNFAMTDFMRGVKNMYDSWTFGNVLEFPGKPPMEIIEVDDIFGIDDKFKFD